MKSKLLIILLLVFGTPTFAQLTKSVVENKFPLLKLPYTTKDLVSKLYIYDGPINDPSAVKFLKSEVTPILKSYKDGAMYFENNSKCYAIGRIVNAGKTFILYLESARNKNTGYGENQIFIVSLDNNYQPVESKSIGYYYETTSYDNESNTIYNITDIYASILSLPNGLNLKIFDNNEKNKNMQSIIKKDTYNYDFFFNTSGKLIEIPKK